MQELENIAPAADAPELEPKAEIVVEVPESTPETDAEKADKAARKVQERFDRLTREKYELKGKLAAYEEQRKSQEPVQQKQVSKVDPSQFDNDADYIRALVQEERAEQRRHEQFEQRKAQAAEVDKKSGNILEEAAKIGGFDIEEFIPLPAVFGDVVLESDMSAKIVAHLQKNPDEIDRIAKLSPARQAMEVGKLEEKLASMTAKKSGAPSPIKPLGSSPSQAPLEKLSTEDYIKRRNAESKNR